MSAPTSDAARDAARPGDAEGVLRRGPWSLRVRPRELRVAVVLAAAALVVAFVTLGTGALPLSPWAVVRTLVGLGDGGESFALFDLGLPRVLTAVLVGAALGVGGMLVQTYTRNPLGSPDVIGIDEGAAAGAVVAILILHQDTAVASLVAVGTGLATAALVVGVSMSRTGLDGGYRLILVGIGAGAALTGLTSYLISRARVEDAKGATQWIAGSLADATLTGSATVAVVLALTAVPTLLLAWRLRVLQLGDQMSTALGVGPRSTGVLVILAAVALSAVAVSVAGPIPFIALAAPQLTRRLTGGSQASVLGSAAMGAFLLVLSDLVAQRAFGSVDLPVGVVTGVVGGLYLVWILARAWKRRRG